MRKAFLVFGMATCLSLGMSNEATAQRFCVRVRPSFGRVAPRPVAYRPTQVWIDGDWVWDARIGNYVFRDGYWSDPRPREVWVAGRWQRARRGDYWVPGYWRRY